MAKRRRRLRYVRGPVGGLRASRVRQAGGRASTLQTQEHSSVEGRTRVYITVSIFLYFISKIAEIRLCYCLLTFFNHMMLVLRIPHLQLYSKLFNPH